jgi:hypothetical protein
VSLFELDKHALELMVLKRLSAYLSARHSHQLAITMGVVGTADQTSIRSSAGVEQTTGECMAFAMIVDATSTAVNVLLDGCRQDEARALLGAALAAWSSGNHSASLASINQSVEEFNARADVRHGGRDGGIEARQSSGGGGFAQFSLGQSVRGAVGSGAGSGLNSSSHGLFGGGGGDGSGSGGGVDVCGGRIKNVDSWHRSTHYMVHALECHLFALENALLCLYAKLRALGKHAPKSVSGPELVGGLLEHANLLAFYYGRSHDRSPLEQVEVYLREIGGDGEPFVLAILRRMRDLYHRGDSSGTVVGATENVGFGANAAVVGGGGGRSGAGMFNGGDSSSGFGGFGGGTAGPYSSAALSGATASGAGGFRSFGR